MCFRVSTPELPSAVLIETLWNVNRFNYRVSTLHVEVLIETLWNVNQKIIRRQFRLLSINRNIVECKSVKCNVLSPVSSVLIETLWNVNLIINHCKLSYMVY